jgi:hypothetical protein
VVVGGSVVVVVVVVVVTVVDDVGGALVVGALVVGALVVGGIKQASRLVRLHPPEVSAVVETFCSDRAAGVADQFRSATTIKTMATVAAPAATSSRRLIAKRLDLAHYRAPKCR